MQLFGTKRVLLNGAKNINSVVKAAGLVGADLAYIADLEVTTVGGNVTVWTDQISGVKATISSTGVSGGFYPSLEDGTNNRKTLTYHGGYGEQLDTTYNAVLHDFAAYVVYRTPVGAVNAGGARLIDKNAFTGFWIGCANPTYPRQILSNIFYPNGAGVATRDGEWNIIRVTRSGTSMSLAANSTVATTTTVSTPTSSDVLSIGGVLSAGTSLSGNIACVVLVPSFSGSTVVSDDPMMSALFDYYSITP